MNDVAKPRQCSQAGRKELLRRVFQDFLGIAVGLLGFAFGLFQHAFCLLLFVTDQLAEEQALLTRNLHKMQLLQSKALYKAATGGL